MFTVFLFLISHISIQEKLGKNTFQGAGKVRESHDM